MTELTEFIIVLFAVYRMALLPRDEIILPFMVRLGAKSDAMPPYHLVGTNLLTRMLLCIYCFSFWMGLAAALYLDNPWYYGFAYSGGAVAIYQLMQLRIIRHD